jgi:hypothetical protein
MLHVSRARVSQPARLGLPVRADGLIEIEEACRWIIASVDPGRDAPSPCVAFARRLLLEGVVAPCNKTPAELSADAVATLWKALMAR